MTNEELVSTVSPIVYQVGASFYFTPDTIARGASLGLDAVGFYVMGRGGVLGNVEPGVVTAAFGYFNPALVSRAWAAGCEKVQPRVAGTAFMQACADHGRAKLASVEGLDRFAHLLGAVNDAALPDGLALYSAVAAEPLVDDAPGRAMQLIVMLREYRGSAHLIALRAVGISSKDAHFVKRPNDVGMFGWSADDSPVIDDQLTARMNEAEAMTDRIVAPAWSVLDDSGRSDVVNGLQAIAAAISS